MIGPHEKLLAKGNDTIQIIITRACDLAFCSNCTQLIPFRKDVAYMSLEVFREAVESVREWPGVVALFGGNPCLHPQFESVCAILAEVIPDSWRRGIWSNNLRQHGRVVRDTFFPAGRFNLNAHGNARVAAEMESWCPGKVIRGSAEKPSFHSSILVNRSDLRVSNEDWYEARERCDINQRWSAAIAERDGKPYAYFCEVGASLDGIRRQNNGMLATPGWWRLPMAAFENQVERCCDAGCGVPLRLQGHRDLDFTYDVSASWSAIAQARGRVRVETTESAGASCEEATDYMRLRTRRT